MGWHPEDGLIERSWTGYNEGMLVNILALGSPTYPAAPGLWDQWTAPYPQCWRGSGPTRRLAFAPMFGHQYSHIFIDFRGIRDAAMREAGFDYFENSRRETYAQRAYAIANPMRWRGYSDKIWGITACDGPAVCAAAVPRRETNLLRLCRARADRRARRARRRHDRADRCARIAAVCAGDRHSLRRRPAPLAGPVRPLRLQGQLQSQLHLHVSQERHRHDRPALRLGGERLYRHRPGRDPAPGRELPQRVRVALHAPLAGDPARTHPRRIHWRLARPLEPHVCAELEGARRRGRGAGNERELIPRSKEVVRRGREVVPVEQVEHLCGKTELAAAAEVEELLEPQVDLEEAGACR